MASPPPPSRSSCWSSSAPCSPPRTRSSPTSSTGCCPNCRSVRSSAGSSSRSRPAAGCSARRTSWPPRRTCRPGTALPAPVAAAGVGGAGGPARRAVRRLRAGAAHHPVRRFGTRVGDGRAHLRRSRAGRLLATARGHRAHPAGHRRGHPLGGPGDAGAALADPDPARRARPVQPDRGQFGALPDERLHPGVRRHPAPAAGGRLRAVAGAGLRADPGGRGTAARDLAAPAGGGRRRCWRCSAWPWSTRTG